MATGDNPFEKWAPAAGPSAAPQGDNPFEKFASPDPGSGDAQAPADPVLETVRELLKRGASSHDIHLYLQSVKHDDVKGVDQAAQYLAQNPGKAGDISVAPDGIASPETQGHGALEAGVGEFANGATGGFLDKITAGINAVVPLDKLGGKNEQSIWDGKSLSDAYHHNLDLERGISGAEDKAHPVQSMVLNAGGAIASPLNRVFGAAAGAIKGESAIASAARTLLPDAAFGATYGAGGSDATTWGGEGEDALLGAGAGAIGGAVGRGITAGAGKLFNPAIDAGKKVLSDAGVTLTPLRNLGGVGAVAEDALGSMPIVGSVIKGGQERNGQEFVVGGIKKALEPLAPFADVLDPLKKELPQNVSGSEAMTYMNDAFNAAYAKARAGMQFLKDDKYGADIAALADQVRNGGADSLTPQYRKMFMDVVKGTVDRRVDENGVMSGDVLKKVLSSIDKKAFGYSKAYGDIEKQAFGDALSNLSAIIDDAARRNPASAPEAVALLDAADKGYATKVILDKAGSTLGSEPGSYTPKQLLAAVKNNDFSARKTKFNEGKAPLQDYAQAGVKYLSPKVGNSGTADRLEWGKFGRAAVGLGGAGALGYELDGHTGAAAGIGVPVAAALLAAGPYSRGGNAFLTSTLARRPAFSRVIGQQINRFAPAIGTASAAGGANALTMNRAIGN